jgi:hypothetical protein
MLVKTKFLKLHFSQWVYLYDVWSQTFPTTVSLTMIWESLTQNFPYLYTVLLSDVSMLWYMSHISALNFHIFNLVFYHYYYHHEFTTLLLVFPRPSPNTRRWWEKMTRWSVVCSRHGVNKSARKIWTAKAEGKRPFTGHICRKDNRKK